MAGAESDRIALARPDWYKAEIGSTPPVASILDAQLPIKHTELHESQKPVRQSIEWADVANPITNALYARPWNAIANVAKFVNSANSIEKVSACELPQAEFLTLPWLAQTVSGGLATSLVYGLAGTACGALIRNAGTANLLGAVAYDTARDPEHGESRLGNFVTGLTCFGSYAALNPFAKGFVGSELHLTRAAIGVGGSIISHTLGTAISTHDLPSWEEVTRVGITGGIINPLISHAQESLLNTPSSSESHVQVPHHKRQVLADESFSRLIDEPQLSKSIPSEGQTSPKEQARLDWKILTSLNKRLKGYKVETSPFLVSTNESRNFSTYEDFLSNGRRTISPRMRVYNVDGIPGTKLVVPEALSNSFNRLMTLKFLRSHADEIDVSKYKGSSREKLERLLEESKHLEQHELFDKLPFQKAIPMIDSLPYGGLIDRVTWLGHKHWKEAWLKLIGDSHPRIVGGNANGNHGREILTFAPQDEATTRSVVMHEVGHHTEETNPVASKVFHDLAAIEPRTLAPPSTCENLREKESWASMVETILGEDPLRLTELTINHPSSMRVVARCLYDKMVSGAQLGPESWRLFKLTRTLERQAAGPSTESLTRHNEGRDPVRANAARRALSYLSRL